MRRETWMDKTGRFFHVDRFVEITMEEDILNVQLVDVPAVDQGKSDKNPNYAWANNRWKDLVVVNTIDLMKAFSD